MPELLEPPVKAAVEKPAAPPANPAEESRELLQKLMQERQDRMMGRAKAKAEEPVKAADEPPKKAAKKKVEPEPVKVEAKEEQPEPVTPPVSPAVDSKLIADSVGRAVKEALNTREKPEPKPEQPKADSLPAEEQEKQNDLVALEKLFPKEYKDIASERVKFLDRQRKLEEKWIDEHPGEDFDPNATEHDEFFAQDPINRVDSRHLAKAIAKQMVEAERASTDERIQQLATTNRVQPQADKDSSVLAVRVAGSVGGEVFKSIVNIDGSINDEQRQKLMETDPVRAQVTADAAYTAKTVIGETVKIFNNATQFNPKSNPTHELLRKYWMEAESDLLAAGPEWFAKNDPQKRSLDDFITFEEFYRMEPKDRAGKWSIGEVELKPWIAHRVAENAKKIIAAEEQKLESLAKRRGYTLPNGKKPAEPASVKNEEQPDDDDEKPDSPSSSTEPKLAGVKGAPQSELEKAMEARMNRFMGR